MKLFQLTFLNRIISLLITSPGPLTRTVNHTRMLVPAFKYPLFGWENELGFSPPISGFWMGCQENNPPISGFWKGFSENNTPFPELWKWVGRSGTGSGIGLCVILPLFWNCSAII